MIERRARAAVLALALASGACRHLAGLPPHLAECAGPLRPTEEIPGDFTRSLRVRVRGAGVDEALGLVVQKSGARLVVLATNAFGAKLFATTQEGERVRAQSFVGPALAVPPENVLRDLHAAYFLSPEQRARSSRSVEPADGGVRVASAACGTESLFVPVDAPPPTP